MKKTLLSVLCFSLFALVGQAQVSFSDDFESYAPGDLIAQTSSDWTTWGGGTIADDAPISDEQAFSGSNSLKLVSLSPNGGPADVVLPFGDSYELGTFTYSMMMYIEPGTGGYFNFQGDEVIGTTWVTNFFFDANGNIDVTDGDNALQGSGEFAHGEWFEISATIDLTANNWVIAVNGEEIANFANGTNKIASLDLYPLYADGTSTYYVDDVAFSYEPPVFPDLDGTVQIDMRAIGLTGQELPIDLTVRNLGMNDITSFDVTFSDGANNVTESFSGLTIAMLEDFSFTMDASYSVIEGGNTVTATLSNVNGTNDEDPSNDVANKSIEGITPASDRGVLVEEATGTWCQWCPRGAVFMGLMEEYYSGFFVGVAVHNGDPMEVAEYDAGMTSLPGFTGFPSVAVERDVILDPSQMEPIILDRLQEPAIAKLGQVITIDEASGEMTVTAQATFNQAASGDYRLNVILIENGVTGTGAGYNQINAYAGGGNGPMGGYEDLPGVVPAALMVYDEVGRAILGGYAGASGSLPASMEAGTTYEYTYSYAVPAAYDIENMKVITILVAPDGTVANAYIGKLENTVSSTTNLFANHLAEVFPNPANTEVNVRLALPSATEVEIQLFNSTGQLVRHLNMGTMSGNLLVPITTADLGNGMYTVLVKTNEHLISKKVQIVK